MESAVFKRVDRAGHENAIPPAHSCKANSLLRIYSRASWIRNTSFWLNQAEVLVKALFGRTHPAKSALHACLPLLVGPSDGLSGGSSERI
jgi:hypothetical protein